MRTPRKKQPRVKTQFEIAIEEDIARIARLKRISIKIARILDSVPASEQASLIVSIMYVSV